MFDLKDQMTYKTAQNLAMFPENTAEDVLLVLKHLKITDSEKQFVFEENSPDKKGTKYPFLTPCSIF